MFQRIKKQIKCKMIDLCLALLGAKKVTIGDLWNQNASTQVEQYVDGKLKFIAESNNNSLVLTPSGFKPLYKIYKTIPYPIFILKTVNGNTLRCAIMQGFDIAKSADLRGQNKLIFGSKKIWEKRQRNEITNEEWKQSRLLPIYSIGETNQKGNRKFVLDIDNNQILFKSNKNNHYVLNIEKIARNQLRLLGVANNLLNTTLAAISKKADMKIKKDVVLSRSKKISINNSENTNIIVADRNELLKLRKQK